MGSGATELPGRHRPQPTRRYRVSSARRCSAWLGTPPGVPVSPAQHHPFTFEPASSISCQAHGQPQADARGAARDQHRGFLHGQAVLDKGTAPFKRVGRGGPPASRCVVSAALSQGPSTRLPACAWGSLCLDAHTAAAIKTSWSQDPPAGGGSGTQGEPQPRGSAPAGASPNCTVPCQAPRHASGSAFFLLCRLGGQAPLPCPPFHTSPTPGRGDEHTHRRKERSAARPLIALQAGSTVAGLCFSPSKGGKKAQKTLSQGARPQHHCRKFCKASFDTKGTKRGGGRAAAGAPQALGFMGQAATRLQGGPGQGHTRDEADSPLPLGAGAALPPPLLPPPWLLLHHHHPRQPGRALQQGHVCPVPLSLRPSAQSQLPLNFQLEVSEQQSPSPGPLPLGSRLGQPSFPGNRLRAARRGQQG